MPDQIDMTCEHDIEPHKTGLKLKIKAYVLDNEHEDAVSVIDCDAGGKIVVEWDVEGELKSHLCGKWCVTAFLESIGPGPEIALPNPCDCTPFNCDNPGPWRKEFDLPGGGIECTDCGSLYQIAVTLTSKDCNDRPGHIAAYCKGATVMFYKGAPEN